MKFRSTYALTLTVVVFFLVLDFLRRYTDHFEGLTPLPILENIVSVFWAAVLISAAAAGCIFLAELCITNAAHGAGLKGYRDGFTSFFLFFVFLSVNLLFLKYRLTPWFKPLAFPARAIFSALALCAVVPLYLALREQREGIMQYYRDHGAAIVKGALVCAAALALIPAAALGGRWAAAGRPAPGGAASLPNIIMISFDGLSARDMSLYGYGRPTTPGLEALAKESVVFDEFHAASNNTNTAIPFFQGYYMTGKLPGRTMTEVLEENGYPNVCFIAHWRSRFHLIPSIRHNILTRAFDGSPLYGKLRALFSQEGLIWLSSLSTEELGYFNAYDYRIEDEYHWYWRKQHAPADLDLAYALEYLQEHPKGTFLWAHLWGPHYPYLPEPPFKGMFGKAELPDDPFPMHPPLINADYTPGLQMQVEALKILYDEYVATLDARLAAFIAQLKARGLYDNSILIVSADHGQTFERGYVGQGGFLNSEPMLRIPLIIHFPGMTSPKRVKAFAEQADLAPTILEYLHLPVPRQMSGESLAPYIENGEKLSTKPKFSISYFCYTGKDGEISVFWKRYKLTYWKSDPNRCRLYDLYRDPGETTDLSAKMPELCRKLSRLISF